MIETTRRVVSSGRGGEPLKKFPRMKWVQVLGGQLSTFVCELCGLARAWSPVNTNLNTQDLVITNARAIPGDILLLAVTR